MILSTRRAVFIGNLRSQVSWASIVAPRRAMTRTPADRAIGRRYRRGLRRAATHARPSRAALSRRPRALRTIAQGDQALANGFRHLRA
jgi:hypothetical protein